MTLPAAGRTPRLLGVLVLGAVLRIPRALSRWDEVSWQYASYVGPQLELLQAGDFWGALRHFSALHPPLWYTLQAIGEALLPIPLLALLLSTLVSLGAVALLARCSLMAALVLAADPIQVHYAAEINNYPWVALLAAAAWVAREHAAETGRWLPLAIVGIAGAWTHGLVGWVAGLAALTLPGALALRVLVAMALGVAPLFGPATRLAMDSGTFIQPPIKPSLIMADLVDRFGVLWLALLPCLLLGLRVRPGLAFGLLGTAAFILVCQALGAAAPHQFPYLLALGPPAALLVAAGAGKGTWRKWVGGIALVQALGSVIATSRGLVDIYRDQAQHRAIDQALIEVSPGDAIFILAPPRIPDDDKRANSPTLWRLLPWQAMPLTKPYAHPLGHHRHGSPRQLGSITVYVHDKVHPELSQAIAAHTNLFLVVTDPKGDPRFSSDISTFLSSQSCVVDPETIGPDLLFRLGCGHVDLGMDIGGPGSDGAPDADLGAAAP